MIQNINIHGAKNSALPIIAATLLFKKKYILENVPMIDDILTQINILKQFNVDIQFIDNNIIIDTRNIILPSQINYDTNTRGTYYFIGSTIHYDINLNYLLGNGCNIDTENRKINYHLDLIKLAGKEYIFNNNKLQIFGNFVENNCEYKFTNPSVGGTINGLLIFSKINCSCVLKNYAKDPYIFDMINFLKLNGVNIEYTDDFIKINGYNENNDNIKYKIISDPIEALSYIIFSGIYQKNNTISSYTIGPIDISHFGIAFQTLQNIGIELIQSKIESYYFIKKDKIKNFNIKTDYYPGIYTDIQPFFAILGLESNTQSIIQETIWFNRFNYAKEINKINEHFNIFNNMLITNNITKDNQSLKQLNCSDLRGGMALLMYILKNNINCQLNNLEIIDRGYYDYKKNLDVILNEKTIIYTDYSTKSLTNINIGGYTKYYIEVTTLHELQKIISFSEKINKKYKLIGGGYNIYFNDYYDGIIIKNNIKYIEINNFENNSLIKVSSGFILMDLVTFCLNNNLDISNLAGIPGTVGGSIYGNCGAYGLEIKDILVDCTILENNEITTYNLLDMSMNYRTSILKKTNSNKIILCATFNILKSNLTYDEINNKIYEILKTRNSKFNINEPTLGCIFKNPIINEKKYYAWEILNNLRGHILKNLKFSEINPNILYNVNNASSEDFNDLLEYLINKINIENNINLEKEIELID
jgi:UDP-N-acetylglucosamine 1-carboxyvinyltransferase